MHSFLLVVCFVSFTLLVQSKTICSYGPLTYGVTSWGLDIDYNQIPGSLNTAPDGPSTLGSFNNLLTNFSAMYIVFAPLSGVFTIVILSCLIFIYPHKYQV